MRSITTGLLASIAVFGLSAAHAQDEIVIRDLFGTVTLDLTGDGPVSISKSGPEASEVEINGGTVTGPEEIERRRWYRSYQNERKGWRNQMGRRGEDPAFEEMLEDQPTITISAPRGTRVLVEGSAIKLTASGTAGDVTIDDNVHVLVKMDDIGSGDLGVHGSGFMQVGDVAGKLEGSVHGSGDLIFGNAESAELSVHGSGDLEGRNIAGRLEASVHGSGDLEVRDVSGRVDASVHGSGDLEIASAQSGLEASVHGSGDLKVGEVTNRLAANIHGSGDLDVADGSVDEIRVSVMGSGEFSYGGSASNAVLRSHGSGSIRVAEVSGTIEANGKDIRVGGNKVGNKNN